MTEGEKLFLQGKIDDACKALETEKNGRSLYLLGLIDREGYGHHRADEEKGQSRFMEGKKMRTLPGSFRQPLPAMCLPWTKWAFRTWETA